MIKVENIKLLQKEVEEIKETSYTSAQIDNMMSTSFEGVFDAMEQYETKSGAEIKYSTKEHKHTASDIEGIDVSVDLSNYYNKQEVDDKVKIKSEFYFAEGETITINNSPCNHNLSDINIYGKTIENNGLMSLGQAENNAIKIQCESLSTINKIPWTKEEYIKLVGGETGTVIDNYTGGGADNTGRIGIIGINNGGNRYKPFIPAHNFQNKPTRVTVDVASFSTTNKISGFTSCVVDGQEYTSEFSSKTGWRTYVFIVAPNTPINFKYASSSTAGTVGFRIDYSTLIVEPLTVEGVIDIQLTEPLRSTIDGTVCDELTPTKVLRRVKEENGQIVTLAEPIVEWINPFQVPIKQGDNRITLGNEIKTKIKINYPLTPMSKAIEQENRINDIDDTLYGINTNVEVANERLDGHNTQITELFQSVSSGKTLLETAITDKGGMVSKVGEVATFEELSNGIKSIVGGELPPEELAGKQMILELLYRVQPSLRDILSLDSPLSLYANHLYRLLLKMEVSMVTMENTEFVVKSNKAKVILIE